MGKAHRRLAGLALAFLAIMSGDASLGSDWTHGSFRLAANDRGVKNAGEKVAVAAVPTSNRRGAAPKMEDASEAVRPHPAATVRGDVDLGQLQSHLASVRTIADLYKFRNGLTKVFHMTSEMQNLLVTRQKQLMAEEESQSQGQYAQVGTPEQKIPLDPGPNVIPKDPSKEDASAAGLPPTPVPVAVKENPTVKDVGPEPKFSPSKEVATVPGPVVAPVVPVSGPVVSSEPKPSGNPDRKPPTPEKILSDLKADSDRARAIRESNEDVFAQFNNRPSPSQNPARGPASVTDEVDDSGHGGAAVAAPLSDEPDPMTSNSVLADKPGNESPTEEGRKRFSEKLTAAVEDAEAALADPNTPPDLLQSKLDTLLAYAEQNAKQGNQDEGLLARIGSLTPQPVTIINRIEYPNFPVPGGVKEKVVLGGQLPPPPPLEDEWDPKSGKRKPGVTIGELLPAREAKVLPGSLFPKKKMAAGQPAPSTAPEKTTALAEVAKVSKSLIQNLRDAIAARKGIVRPGLPTDEASPMTALVRSVGRNVAVAKGKIANLYMSAGFGNPSEGNPVATAVGLVCLFGLASAAVMSSRRKRPRVQ